MNRSAVPVLLAVATVLGGCSTAPIARSATAQVSIVTTVQSAHSPVTSSIVAERSVPAIDALVVKPKVFSPKYSRTAQFGGWSDTDGNHCDTRNDILRRDLRSITFKAKSMCLVQTGSLKDPYTGKSIHFVRGPKTSALVEIDHIVSVADAWRSGAYAWTPLKRVQFYNDSLNLQATSRTQNNLKSDKTADRWLPMYNRCTFARKQIAVKARWHLTVSAAEKAALKGSCH